MELDGWLTLAIIAGMVVGLVMERSSPDALVLGALVLMLVLGLVEPEEAFRGFASPAVVTVAALFVLAAALRSTGAIDELSRMAFGRTSGERGAMLRLTGVTSASSAFLNNTPIVAMLLPATLEFAKRQRIAASRLLIPLSYAAIVGGVCTLIGTSTNLVVSGLLEARGLRGMGMFELSRVGVPVALAALAFLALFGRRLLPARSDALFEAEGSAREYVVEMRLERGSPLEGRTVEEAELRHLPGLFLARIERQSGLISPVGPGERLRGDDALTFVGVVETIVDLQRFRGLVPAGADAAATPRFRLHEAVVSPSSPLVGSSVREANFRGRYNAVVVAVHRHGERVEGKIGDIELRPGDTLLIEGPPGFARSFRDSPDFYLVSEVEASEAPRHHRRWHALGLLAGVVGLAALGLLPIAVAALLGAMGALLLRCLTPGEARRAVDGSVLIVIAASFGLAAALENSGVAALVGHGLVGVASFAGPIAVLACIYAVTMVMTELVSNNAAAALVFPVALVAAETLGADPRPFVLTVAVAASLSLMTPLGYQTNMMVYGPGGYHFTDFLRIGLPLQLLLAAIALPLLALAY